MARRFNLVALAREADLSVLQFIEREMEVTGGNISEVARRCKCSREAIYQHIRAAKRPVRLHRTHSRGVRLEKRAS